MSRMDDFERGKRVGIRTAIRWLHARADEMNDGHAKAILNTAAFNLGVDRAQNTISYENGESDGHPEA